jgi:hypothetical protein
MQISVALLYLLTNSRSFLPILHIFYMDYVISEQREIYSFLPNLVFFSCLTALTRTSIPTLKTAGERGFTALFLLAGGVMLTVEDVLLCSLSIFLHNVFVWF